MLPAAKLNHLPIPVAFPHGSTQFPSKRERERESAHSWELFYVNFLPCLALPHVCVCVAVCGQLSAQTHTQNAERALAKTKMMVMSKKIFPNPTCKISRPQLSHSAMIGLYCLFSFSVGGNNDFPEGRYGSVKIPALTGKRARGVEINFSVSFPFIMGLTF